jgi:SynChlorMet cassette protein ScmD
MTDYDKVVVSPYVQLREEFDDWAILFDSDTGKAFGLNPTGVYVWKLLGGEHTLNDLLTALGYNAPDVSQDAREQLIAFLDELTEYGLAADFGDRWSGAPPCRRGPSKDTADGGRMLRYEQPRLVHFTQDSRAVGKCQNGSGDTGGDCRTGHLAACTTGGQAGYPCYTGSAAAACGAGNHYSDGPAACYAGNSPLN